MKNLPPNFCTPIWLLLLFWLGLFVVPAYAQLNKTPLKVFVLVGQSNMQGHAKISTFDYIGDDEATKPMLQEMRRADGEPTIVNDTWISYLTQGRKTANGEGIGQLTAGFGARSDPAKIGDKIGPEFTFGIYLQKKLKQPILIIKTAWGGKSLHTDFRPPSAGPYEYNETEREAFEKRGLDLKEEQAKRQSKTGVYYRYMVDHVNHVLSDIKSVVPDYDASQGYEIAGMVWFQGWNDLVDRGVYPNRDQKGGYDQYSDCMTKFIRDVRKDLEAPRMPFVIGVLGVNGPIENINPRYQQVYLNFRAAMAAPSMTKEFGESVRAVDTSLCWDMPLDRIQKKREELNQRKRQLTNKVKKGKLKGKDTSKEIAEIDAKLTSPEMTQRWKRGASNAGYHYYGCAKTMALIGKAFAEAVLELQPEAKQNETGTETLE